MRPEGRNIVPLESVGLSVAVPVFVDRADRLHGRRRKAKQLGDVRATFAAGPDSLAGAFRALRKHRHRSPHPRQPESARRDVTCHEPERLGEASPVDRLDRRLEVLVVGAEQRGKTRGVARTAQILHEQGVEERGPLGLVEADRLANPHADRANCGRRVPWRWPSVRSSTLLGQPSQHVWQVYV